MQFKRNFVALMLMIGITLVAKASFSQAVPRNSDLLAEGTDLNPPFDFPYIAYVIPEVVPEAPQVFEFPDREISFNDDPLPEI